MVDSEKFLDIWSIIKPKFLKAGRVSCLMFFFVVMVIVSMETDSMVNSGKFLDIWPIIK